MSERVCRQCQGPLPPQGPGRTLVYCSRQCSRKYWNTNKSWRPSMYKLLREAGASVADARRYRSRRVGDSFIAKLKEGQSVAVKELIAIWRGEDQ